MMTAMQYLRDLKECQWCGSLQDAYTCSECEAGWPRGACKCENNGDFCDACDEYVEQRTAVKETRKQAQFEAWLKDAQRRIEEARNA